MLSAASFLRKGQVGLTLDTDIPCSTTSVKGAGNLSMIGYVGTEWTEDLLT